MRLLLARHGNTFAPGDPVVMTGVTNDLPLVARGEEQAAEVAEYAKWAGDHIAAVYASELRRTQRACEILIKNNEIPLQVNVDSRLNEVDYGAWTGRTDAQIDDEFGAETRTAWQKKSQWPTNANWGESAEEVEARVKSFAAEILTLYPEDQTVFVTAHGGVLRYFLKLVDGEWEKRHEDQTLKVKTGHVCSLTHNGQKWSLDFWNKDPLEG